MRKILLLTFFLLVCSLVLPTASQSANEKKLPKVYEAWGTMPTEELFKKGNSFLLAENKEDSALVCYSIVANRYFEDGRSEAERRRSLMAMNNVGYLYESFYHDYDKAFATLRQALELAKADKDTLLQGYINLNLGNIYDLYYNMVNGSDTNADVPFNLFRTALHQAIAVKRWELAIASLCNILENQFVDNPRYYKTIQSEIALFNRQNIPQNTPQLAYLRQLMRCFMALRNHHYEDALAATYAMEQKRDGEFSAQTELNCALRMRISVLHLMGRHVEAEKLEKRAIEICKKSEEYDDLVVLYWQLYDYYRSTGDTEKAKNYRLAYLEKKESLMNQNKLRNISRQEFLYQIRQANEEVQRLSEQRHWQNIIILIILGIALLTIFFLVLLYRNFRKVRTMNHVLYNNMQESLYREQQLRNERESEAESAEGLKYKSSRLTEDDKTELVEKIERVLANTEEICNAGFSLDRLAELVGASYRETSQVINEHYGKNFKALLSEYRIKEACRRLDDREHYGNLTIEAIAASVGIKSRSHFNTYFKQVTGLSPSMYQKMGREKS
ncbi:MAG: helix-turn-helix domain-containing protein [Prevotella sp.]|jgi:AraC-like DNA-binding protein